MAVQVYLGVPSSYKLTSALVTTTDTHAHVVFIQTCTRGFHSHMHTWFSFTHAHVVFIHTCTRGFHSHMHTWFLFYTRCTPDLTAPLATTTNQHTHTHTHKLHVQSSQPHLPQQPTTNTHAHVVFIHTELTAPLATTTNSHAHVLFTLRSHSPTCHNNQHTCTRGFHTQSSQPHLPQQPTHTCTRDFYSHISQPHLPQQPTHTHIACAELTVPLTTSTSNQHTCTHRTRRLS